MSASEPVDIGGGGGGATGGDDDGYDGGDDDSGGGGGGDDGFVDGVSDSVDNATDFVTGWGDLTLPTTLQTFLSDPRRFVVGAIATTILETVFGVVTEALNIIALIFGGSSPGRLNAPGETLGIVDVPVYIADQLGSIGGSVGDAVITGINNLNEPIFAAAGFAGPLSPLIIAAVVVTETIVTLWLLQRLVFIVADFLQLGGLTE